MNRPPHKPLDEIAEYVTVGYVGPSNEYFCEDGVPFLRTGNVGTRRLVASSMKYVTPNFHAAQKKSQLRRGDVVVSRVVSDEITAAVVTTEFDDANCGNILIVRPGPRLHPEYLVHLICSPPSQRVLLGRQVGSAQAVINTSVLKAWEIPLVPLAEQRRIADILDRADALRAQRRAALAELNALDEATFLDMFGDPVTNPKGWPNRLLGPLLTFQQYGPRFYNETYSENGVRIVRITDLHEDGSLDFSGMPRLAMSPEDKERYLLRPGDFIFARTGATVGKTALIRSGDPECVAGAYFITMRFADTVLPIYVQGVFRAPSIRAIITAKSRQAAQQNFSGPGLRELPLPVPPVPLQREFARRVAAIESLKSSHRASLAELDALFASLQHRAFRGEL